MLRLFRLIALSLLLSHALPAAAEAASRDDLASHKELLQLKLDSQRDLAQKDTDALKARIDALEKRVDDQGNRFSDIGSSVDQFGLIMTMLFALGGFIGYFSVTAKAKEEAKQTAEQSSRQWFHDNDQQLLAEINKLKEEVQKALLEISKEKQQAKQTIKAEVDGVKQITASLQESLNKSNEQVPQISELEKQTLQQSTEELKEKPEASYSFEDWNTRAFAAYSAKAYEDAALYWKRASDLPNAAAANKVQALFNRAITFNHLKRIEEERITYAQLIDQYSPNPTPFIRELVAQAMFNMGFSLHEIKRPTEAIDAFQHLIDTYSDDKTPAIRETVSRAMQNLGIILSKLEEFDKATATFQKLIDNYSPDDTPTIRKQVAAAFNGKGFAMLMQAKQAWQDKTQAEKLLKAAGENLQKSRSHDGSQGIILGNLAYVQWLQGNHAEAEQTFRTALASPNGGGEQLYQATLDDIAMHTIQEEDEGFRAMIERLWREHAQPSAGDTPGTAHPVPDEATS